MVGEMRRQEILKYIAGSRKPVSGTKLSELFQVSRQVIVQDIALLRAADYDIISTNRGYLCGALKKAEHVFHRDDQIEAELNAIVDCGGTVKDVFVQHEIYGELKAPLQISSRIQVRQFLEDIKSGKSKPLTNLTSGHHCHTVLADSDEILDLIGHSLRDLGICDA